MNSQVEQLVIDTVNELTQDWDLEEIIVSRETALSADAGFESLDIVQLVVLIEKKLGNPGIPFEAMFMQDGKYIDDVKICELADFIVSNSKG